MVDERWNRDGGCGPHHESEPTGSAMCLNAKLSKGRLIQIINKTFPHLAVVV